MSILKKQRKTHYLMMRSLLATSIAMHEIKQLTYYPNLTKKAFLAKILSMNTILDLMKTPREIELEIAKNARRRRKEAGLTQEELARKSGVSLGSLKRFENKGKISMESLIKIAVALDYQEDFLKLFTQRRYRSIEEIIHERD